MSENIDNTIKKVFKNISCGDTIYYIDTSYYYEYGKCPLCKGEGTATAYIRNMEFTVTCPVCKGKKQIRGKRKCRVWEGTVLEKVLYVYLKGNDEQISTDDESFLIRSTDTGREFYVASKLIFKNYDDAVKAAEEAEERDE